LVEFSFQPIRSHVRHSVQVHDADYAKLRIDARAIGQIERNAENCLNMSGLANLPSEQSKAFPGRKEERPKGIVRIWFGTQVAKLRIPLAERTPAYPLKPPYPKVRVGVDSKGWIKT